MRIDCVDGYFFFTEKLPGQMSQFMGIYGLEIARSGDHFTFSDLVDAPEYSLPGGTFLDAPTTVAFAGRPWEVMRENALVYDFTKGLVVPIATVVRKASLQEAANFFMAAGMLVPGSLMDDGSRVKDYSAHYSFDMLTFKYSEVSSE